MMSTIDPNNLMPEEIDEITNEITQYQVEYVTEEPTPKVVFNDAIHLFLESMYCQGSLNINRN